MCCISILYIINSTILEIKRRDRIISTNAPITELILKKSDKWLTRGVDEILKLGDEQQHKSNVKANMTSWTIWKDTKYFNQLFNDITDILKALNLKGLRGPNRNPILTGCWGAHYKDNEKTQIHNHEPAWYSFVYYLKTDPNCAPIIFQGSNVDLPIYPKPNMLILFPAHLGHYVPPTKGERVVLAGNFFVNIN